MNGTGGGDGPNSKVKHRIGHLFSLADYTGVKLHLLECNT